MLKLIGIPFDANSTFLRGPAFAPKRIRLMDTEGSANTYAENGVQIKENQVYVDCGDLEIENTQPEPAFTSIQTGISNLLEDGSRVLVLGGDHSISYPVISAFADVYPGLNILHLDAHADLYEYFDNNHYSHASPFARLMEEGKAGSLTQVGIRTLNTHQQEQADKYGVKIVEMRHLSYDFLASLEGPLYVSIDLDVLDPAFAPGVSHHEPGGMSTRQLIDIIQRIPVDIVGADIVEYNPVRDHQNMTAMVAYKVFKEVAAKMAG